MDVAPLRYLIAIQYLLMGTAAAMCPYHAVSVTGAEFSLTAGPDRRTRPEHLTGQS
jgi:hypothetical protein